MTAVILAYCELCIYTHAVNSNFKIWNIKHKDNLKLSFDACLILQHATFRTTAYVRLVRTLLTSVVNNAEIKHQLLNILFTGQLETKKLVKVMRYYNHNLRTLSLSVFMSRHHTFSTLSLFIHPPSLSLSLSVCLPVRSTVFLSPTVCPFI